METPEKHEMSLLNDLESPPIYIHEDVEQQAGLFLLQVCNAVEPNHPRVHTVPI